MKTIPFDFELRKDIQSEENGYKGRYKVQAKSGKPARIICWDCKHPKYPIVALVENSSYEYTITCRKNGMHYPTGGESGDDLYLIDTWEPKFELWNKIRCRVTGIVFDVVAIDYVSKKYEVISDSVYTDRRYIMFYEQDDYELATKEIIEKLKEE
jgi:hypothetical protein